MKLNLDEYLARTGLGARAETLNPPKPVKPVRYIDQVGIDMARDESHTAHLTITTDHRWTIFIETQLKSQNAFKHWRERHKETLRFQTVIHFALLEQGFRTGSPHAGKQRLTIIRHLGPRQRLWDDAFGNGGSTKQLVDAIKRLGWMTDDSPRWLEGKFIQDTSRRDRPGTTITLERLRLERTK